MKLLSVVLRYELRLQGRSLRLRIVASAYLLFCALPPVFLYLTRQASAHELGAASYLGQLLQVQPLLTVGLAALVAGHGAGREARHELWPVLSAAAVSSAGYLLRRWLAVSCLLVPLTAVPFAIAATLAGAAGTAIHDPSAWVLAWALRIVPIAPTVAALWLGLVIITGSELGAVAVAYLGGQLLAAVVGQLLLLWRRALWGLGDWFGLAELNGWIRITIWRLNRPQDPHLPPLTLSEAPFDAPLFMEWLLPRSALGIGLAGLSLAVASAFVGRTQRDLRPLVVASDHPVRTLIGHFNRARLRYAADGALGLLERAAIGFAIVALAAMVTALFLRADRFERLAERRYHAEIEVQPPPLDPAVAPHSWRVSGEVERRGTVHTTVVGVLRHHGDEPIARLPFTLNAGVEVRHLEGVGHRTSFERHWDRLLVAVEPPLEPSETLELRFELRGLPTQPYFPLLYRSGDSFTTRFEAFRNARFPRDLADLSRSLSRPAVSVRRLHLAFADLSPVPRYTTWQLTAPSNLDGRQVPEELYRPEVELELDLMLPSGRFAADVCGHTTTPVADGQRFAGRCRTTFADYAIYGGSMKPLDHQRGKVVVATLPAHRHLGESLGEPLATAAALSGRAWPGRAGLESLVVLEWPPAFDADLSRRPWSDRHSEPSVQGQLLLIPEARLSERRPLEARDLVAQIVMRDLLARRSFEVEQEHVFRAIFRALMLRRMGLADGRGAIISGPPWLPSVVKRPLLSGWSGHLERVRIPALMAEIASRAGAAGFYRGIEAFLDHPGDEPGTVRELLTSIERQAGISLERMYQDYFLGTALPELQLEEVIRERQGSRWRVTGQVRNKGTGEVLCPLIVKAEIGEARTRLLIDSQSAVAFDLTTEKRPHTVLLDPDGECHRLHHLGSSALERARFTS